MSKVFAVSEIDAQQTGLFRKIFRRAMQYFRSMGIVVRQRQNDLPQYHS